MNIMSEIRLPKSDDKEVDFWDSFDTAQIMEEGEEIKLVYKPETAIENICSQCGEKIDKEKARLLNDAGREDNDSHQRVLLSKM